MTLSKLEGWYMAQCNGEWEHSYGVKIETLDNPGWRIRIDLSETKKQGSELKRTSVERDENDWLECWTEDNRFNLACGPLNLSEAVDFFVQWFESDA